MAEKARRGPSTKQLWIGLLVLVVIWLAVALAKGDRAEAKLKSWCRHEVHVGDYFSSVSLPNGATSVSHGLWQYPYGVSVKFVDGLVYSKTCE